VGDMSRPPTHCPVQQWVARWVADGKNAPRLMRVRLEIKLCQRIILNVVLGKYSIDEAIK
jgi:hypothetical protein